MYLNKQSYLWKRLQYFTKLLDPFTRGVCKIIQIVSKNLYLYFDKRVDLISSDVKIELLVLFYTVVPSNTVSLYFLRDE